MRAGVAGGQQEVARGGSQGTPPGRAQRLGWEGTAGLVEVGAEVLSPVTLCFQSEPPVCEWYLGMKQGSFGLR